jgi:sulfur carrier protein
VNGKLRQAEPGLTLLGLLQQHELDPRVVAIEHNGEIVRRDHFGETAIHEGDVIEIVHMVGGG